MTSSPRRALPALLAVLALAVGTVLAACGDDGGGAPAVELSAAGERGKQVAADNGCASCHTVDGSKSAGPTWQGLAGSQVELEDGTTVTADADYLRAAILQARDETVEGYPNIMPVYEKVLTDAEVDDLIAYLNDLAAS